MKLSKKDRKILLRALQVYVSDYPEGQEVSDKRFNKLVDKLEQKEEPKIFILNYCTTAGFYLSILYAEGALCSGINSFLHNVLGNHRCSIKLEKGVLKSIYKQLNIMYTNLSIEKQDIRDIKFQIKHARHIIK